jgi:uncharacterized protein (TIGR02284 family)
MSDKQKCIDVCNRLLRGEISAVETYDQALEKFQDEPGQSLLQKIRDDHEVSVSTLEEHIASMGATPDSESGIWGGFAQAVEGTAKMLGESPALKILRTGEEHGVQEYQDALSDDDVMEEIKSEIRSSLLPRLKKHLSLLQELPAGAANG